MSWQYFLNLTHGNLDDPKGKRKMKVPTKGKIQNKLHLDGDKAALVRRAIMKVEEPIERRLVKTALEEVNGILGGEGVARCGSLAYVKRDLSTRVTLCFDFDARRWLLECSLLAMFSITNKMRAALRRAAAEAYHSEVEQTEMSALLIGEGREFSSREEWIENRIDNWFRKEGAR